MYGTLLMVIVGTPHHGGRGRAILWHPVQRLMRGQPGRTTFSHHFQYGGGCSDKALGDGGGRGGGTLGRIWLSSLAASGIVIFVRRATCLPSSRTDQQSFGRSDRAVLLGRIEDQHG